MNSWFDANTFMDRLQFWAICGIICAAPSFIIAHDNDFDRRAMAVGTLSYILLFAFVTSAPWYRARLGGSRLGRRLRLATLIRTGIAGVGLLGMGMAAIGMKFPLPIVVVTLDVATGAVAANVTEFVSEAAFGRGASRSFGWTLFTTLLQGAFVSIQLFILAALSLVFPERKPEYRLPEANRMDEIMG